MFPIEVRRAERTIEAFRRSWARVVTSVTAAVRTVPEVSTADIHGIQTDILESRRR